MNAELAQHERLLWAICYRMTGTAADADDLVQDTFVRAIEHGAARSGALKPWLVGIAMNLSRDRLRARKRLQYKGEWLPSPVPTPDDDDDLPSFGEPDPDGPGRRYDLLESVSIAFLLALEALTPKQRAVVLLCDVFERSVREVAATLALSEANVKVLHHRARRTLAAYDASRVPARVASDATRDAIQGFVTALSMGDEAAARALLASDAVGVTDGGATYSAARKPLFGPERITMAFRGFVKHTSPVTSVRWVTLNGAPGLVVDLAPTRPNLAPRVVIQAELDGAGKIRRLYSVLAPEKLTALRASVPLATSSQTGSAAPSSA